MGAQLDQILSYLDKDGVTEVMIGMGQPASLRRRGQLIKITNTPVTRGQINLLIQDTPLVRLIPAGDGVAPRVDLEIGGRMVRVLITRRGEDIVMRIEKSPPGATPSPIPTAAPAATPARGVPVRASSAMPIELDPEVTPPPAAPPRPPTPVAAPPAPVVAPPEPVAAVRTPVPEPAKPVAAVRAPVQEPAKPVAARTPVPAIGANASFKQILQAAIDRGATDLHIASGRVISIRVLGDLVPLDDGGPISHAQAESLLAPLLDGAQAARLSQTGYIDFALASPTGGRLRSNVSRAAGGIKGTFRLARVAPNTLDELGLPKDLAKVVHHHQGLVVIAGPSGHGKTTTLASLVDVVNASRPHHIITVEDPVEIVYPRKAAVVSQREVGAHTRSFAAALKGSLREDPDVIVIGELRDKETVEIALTAAETGHLVLATMSTPSAAKTIDRLVDMFPPEDQAQVRASIAGALRAIVSQRLLPTADGTGVAAAIELVTGVLPLAAMIRDDKLFQLPSLLQRGKAFGMIRMDDSLADLVRAGKVTAEVAIAMSDNKRELAAMLGQSSAPAGAQPAPPPGAPAPGEPEKAKSRFAGLFGKKDR